MKEYTFCIPGKPVGKERWRIRKAGAKERERTGRDWMPYTPGKTTHYENHVRTCFLDKVKKIKPAQGPVSMAIVIIRQMPKSWSKKRRSANSLTPCQVKMDGDNIEKAIMDALRGYAYEDDREVFALSWMRVWGQAHNVYVRIRYLEGKNAMGSGSGSRPGLDSLLETAQNHD